MGTLLRWSSRGRLSLWFNSGRRNIACSRGGWLACFGWRLIRYRRQALGKNVDGTYWGIRVDDRSFVFFLRDHQDFFQLAQVGGGVDAYIQERVRSPRDAGNGARSKPF